MAEVAKFGGTSMAQIDTVLEIIEAEDPSVVVVSAPGKDVSLDGYHSSELGAGEKMTTLLLNGQTEEAEARALEIIDRSGIDANDGREIMASMRSWVLEHSGNQAARAATGERFSAELVAKMTGRILLDPTRLVSINKDRTPDVNVTVGNLRKVLEPSKRFILPGYYGYDNQSTAGGVQILDRGGSDTSGALVALALGARYMNLTDVNGFFTTDPRKNRAAQQIPNLTYKEARALALGGSKLLHPEVARIMGRSGLPTVVRNTFAPGLSGTRITADAEGARDELVGVSSRQVLALDIQRAGVDEGPGIMNGVYDELAREGIPYLLSNDGPDETAIFFDTEVITDPAGLREIAAEVVRDAEITVTEMGLVVAVISHNRDYVRSQVRVSEAAAIADPTVLPSGSLSRQSVELFTDPRRADQVEAAVHTLIAA